MDSFQANLFIADAGSFLSITLGSDLTLASSFDSMSTEGAGPRELELGPEAPRAMEPSRAMVSETDNLSSGFGAVFLLSLVSTSPTGVAADLSGFLRLQ